MTQNITTTISDEYHAVAREHGIKWNDALCRGIKVLVDARTGKSTDDNIREMERKITVLAEKLTIMSRKYYELHEKFDDFQLENGKEGIK